MKPTVLLPSTVMRLLMFFAILSPAAVSAQDTTSPAGKSSHWGVRVSFVPAWEITDNIRDLIYEDDEVGTMKGTEFSIGVARGSTLGGDWGVGFVRKPWDDESSIVSTREDCFNQAQTICRPEIETTQFDGVYLNAFEVHWFKPFVTIKKRVQIGLNIAGGVGSMNGNVILTTDRFEPTGFNNQGIPTGFRPIHEEEVVPAKDELLSIFPLFKLEAEGAFILAPGLKLKVAGGINFPAVSFRVGGVYLIGAK